MLAVSAASIIAAPDRLDGVPLEVLDLIADYLSPGTDAWRPLTPHGFAEMCSECKTSPLIEFTEAMLSDVNEQSRGAAHWLQCARPCGREVWPALEDLGLKESAKHRSDLWPR